GSGSDLAPYEQALHEAPGRYRSLYRTGAPTLKLFTRRQVATAPCTVPARQPSKELWRAVLRV
ncbi:MAG: hypothetical protein MOB07_20640, partial [Acidobacteria bacterium]|nr:hypothetical protein [Acidobacteriota bacterium]